ncbi:MAG: histidine kinase [Gammaproteobacteria bacterium]|jgi:two-component system, LytTR family, sensor histidine kinase AlgZ|nr:histidine kinase [Gammaproteobacteria bacterium]MBT4494649.1 histidine kinase [Gammaproteobacteria bacterium]MBT7369746.1 histidine kinase [Gammaproteobacteria bacterium]
MSDSKPTKQETEQADFFLPDLCQAQSILFLVLIAELLVLVQVLYASSFFAFDWIALGLTSLFVQWLVLISAALLCNIRPWLMKMSVARATIVAYVLILFITLTFSVIAEFLLYGYELTTKGWGRILRNLVVAVIMTGIAFRYFFLSHQLRIQEQAELTSRIQALQSRIRPHFLFNSMNIIASLIAIDPDLAEEVVEDLSVLFRASLDEATGEPVRLDEEISLCEKYLHIESLRLDDRLEVEWQVDVDTTATRIPLLTLQPLLENAVYHGIQPLPEGGLVTVGLKSRGDLVEITITNPVSDKEQRHERGNRMALENIRNRMSAVYGPDASLTTEQTDQHFVTRLLYPGTS